MIPSGGFAASPGVRAIEIAGMLQSGRSVAAANVRFAEIVSTNEGAHTRL